MKFPEKRKLLFVGVFMNGAERLFHGVIDEVNIFDSAISEEMIADLAVRTADKPAGSWTALMDDDGLMYDSASDTTGQLRNGAEWAYDSEFGSVLDLTGNNGSVLLGDPESLQIEGKITLAAALSIRNSYFSSPRQKNEPLPSFRCFRFRSLRVFIPLEPLKTFEDKKVLFYGKFSESVLAYSLNIV